jgi:hypothetical protein
MVVRRCVIVFSLMASITLAQDTIRGSYLYTYGDSESLVEARQTCKDLAIREAIESYYIFVESSTEVESFQMKEDLIQSIAAGFLQNIRVVEQKEEGRTISMTVDASVMPEDVKQLVQKLLEKRENNGQKDKVIPAVEDDKYDSLPVSKGDPLDKNSDSVSGSDASFHLIFYDYKEKWKPVQTCWNQKNYPYGFKKIQELKAFLERRNPSQKNHFYYFIYQALWNHTLLADELLRLEYLESKGQTERSKARAASVIKQSEKLQIALRNMKSLANLSQSQITVRNDCFAQCLPTLNLARTKAVVYRRK